MANLVQAAEELEFVPKEQLIQMVQGGESRFPPYLVLSEIERRTKMERIYKAAATEIPSTSVAEERIAEFKGLSGMGTNGSAPVPNAETIPPDLASPMQEMAQYAASGGRTGFQNIGSTRSRQSLLASLGINPEGMTEEQIEQALKGIQSELGAEEEGGLRALAGRAAGGVRDWFTDDDGTVDWSKALLTAASVHPVGRGLGWGLRALKGVPGALRGLAGSRFGQWAAKGFTKPRTHLTSAAGRRWPADSPQGLMIANLSRNPNLRAFSLPRTLITASYPAGLAAAYSTLSDAGNELTDDTGQTDTDQTENKLNELLAGSGDEDQDNQRRGIVGSVNSYMDQADPLDIAKLGGIIMGSRNITDLGQGISALASDIQTRKTEAEAREDTLRLQEIQGDLYKAQTARYEAEVANMPYDQLVSEFNAVADAYKLLAEQGDPSSPELAEYATYLTALRKAMAAMRGIKTEEESDAEIKDRYRIQ
jgi:hypothetical protein